MANIYCNSIALYATFMMILCRYCTESFMTPSPYKLRSIQREATRPSENDDGLLNQDENKYSLSKAEKKWIESRSSTSSSQSNSIQNERNQDVNEDYDHDSDGAGNVNIPKTGISVSDEMVALQTKEDFDTRLISLDDKDNYRGNRCVPKGVMAAKIETVVRDQIGDEPARYLIPLSPSSIDGTDCDNDATESASGGRTSNNAMKYAMVDVPPFSEKLASQIRSFMASPSSKDEKRPKKAQSGILSNILVTSRDGIHYDESPAVYVSRESDLLSWKEAFPEANIVIYRLDAPRECKILASQVLDGYGPWALEEQVIEGSVSDNDVKSAESSTKQKKSKNTSVKFVETGRPLTQMEWNETTTEQVLEQGMDPPDEDDNDDPDGLFTPEAIRLREAGKEIIALYTPGHTFGSVTYIFPKVKVCCSGYTIPLEDTRRDAGAGSMPGPAMDYRGYITTNQGGMAQQIESARHVIDVYGDRFEAVLPSRGSPVCLPSDSTDNETNVKYRARIWNQLLNDYAELGRVYEKLGII